MDTLWAPWRSKYIENLSEDSECIFCNAVKEKEHFKVLKVFQTKYSIVVLNLYPYNTSHTMIAPVKHTADYEELNHDEILDLNCNVQKTIKIIKKLFNPDAFNLGANIGRIAGAGVPGHFHMHIVPRWQGDTHFLPILAETKVFSFPIEDIFQKMSDEFAKE